MGNFEKLGILVIIILVVVIMVLTIWGGPVPESEPDPTADPNRLSVPAETDTVLLEPGPRPAPEPMPDFPGPDFDEEGETARVEPSAEPAAAALEDLEHVVRQGENLFRIAESYYGDGKYYKEIGAANPSVSPTTMAPGTKLRIPHPDKVLARSAGTARAPAEPAASSPDVYVVKKGDSLSRISRAVYGTEGRWKKIWEANRDVIGDDPARLRPDMRLRIPR